MTTCQYIKAKPTATDKCKCGKPVDGPSSYCAKHLKMCVHKRVNGTSAYQEKMLGVAYNIKRGRI